MLEAKKYEDRLEYTVTLTGNKEMDEGFLRGLKETIDNYWQNHRAIYGGVTFDKHEIVKIKGVRFWIKWVSNSQGALELHPVNED